MALWEEIDPRNQEVFNHLYGEQYLSTSEREYFQELYAAGFGFKKDDYDSVNLTPEKVGAAREAFLIDWGFAGGFKLDDDSDAWQAWREAMGYD